MIHYFTGTGNSYFIASQLATSLNLSLHALKEGPVEDRDPVVGIVFPWADAGSVLVWMRRAASSVVFACAFVR